MSPILTYFLLSLLGSMPASVFTLLCYIKCRQLELQQRDLRHALNSRLDQLVEQSGLLQRAQGRQEGIESTRLPLVGDSR